MSLVLATFNKEGFVSIATEEGGVVRFTADADIDADGSGSSHGDPYFQNDTTLHYNGMALNSDIDKFIVVPPVLIEKTVGIVLGCEARVTNLRNRKTSYAVVGDIGPRTKVGEISIALARALGIPWNPNTGGEDEAKVLYEFIPGKVAVVDGRTYTLKSSSRQG